MSVDENYLQVRLERKRKNARKRGIGCALSVEKMRQLLSETTCFYTGIKLVQGKQGENNNLSIDRVDTTKDYTDDNVVVCASFINLKKADLTLDQIDDMYTNMKTANGLSDKQVDQLFKGIEKWKQANGVFDVVEKESVKFSDMEICKRFVYFNEYHSKEGVFVDISFKRYKQLLNTKYCYFTKQELTHTKKLPNTLVVVRINKAQGYIDGNVVACSSDMSEILRKFSMDQLKNVYHKVTQFEKKSK